ncbi:unnamed protein product [Ranitomeya imitator]|uniref:Uncharacterized protein n=1 Tax=Ranitomeya imitator TaxID=111125 RepID=A0ABN9M4V3_9NEOB|nr:unnamed protein product [Ranitomeya imitator]
MNEKEEKTKKTLLGAKQKLAQLTSLKEQLSSENEDVKQRLNNLEQQKEELEVRMSALKSQYEGRICRLERELREQQERHHEQRDEAQEPSKGPEQRQITVKPTAAAGERGILWCNVALVDGTRHDVPDVLNRIQIWGTSRPVLSINAFIMQELLTHSSHMRSGIVMHQN